jgi:ABC-type nickel/cobalt efflux system permease component RcnA
MITDFYAGMEVVGIVALLIYAMADNERIYASVFASFIATILSALVAYQFLFGLVVTDSGTKIQDTGVGYFFMMIAIGSFALPVIIFLDKWMKNKDRKARGISR